MDSVNEIRLSDRSKAIYIKKNDIKSIRQHWLSFAIDICWLIKYEPLNKNVYFCINKYTVIIFPYFFKKIDYYFSWWWFLIIINPENNVSYIKNH